MHDILLASRIQFYKTLPHIPENIPQSRIMERVRFFFQGHTLKGDLISKKPVLLKDCERAMFTVTQYGPFSMTQWKLYEWFLPAQAV